MESVGLFAVVCLYTDNALLKDRQADVHPISSPQLDVDHLRATATV
jgi:hypothetical protein